MFSKIVKDEIIDRYYKKEFNDIINTYSYIFGLLNGANFDYENLKYSTTSEDLAYFVLRLFEKINIECLIFKNSNRFEVKINKEEFYEKIIDINLIEIDEESYILGMLLTSGRISEPDKSYTLEIRVRRYENDSDNLNVYLKILKKLEEKGIIFGKSSSLKIKYDLIYIKNGDKIAEFFLNLNLNKSLLEFENIRINKDINNSINRVVNFEVANMNKSTIASANQMKAIKYIIDNDLEKKLTSKQLELVNLKKENENITLNEMADALQISKSSISNRFKSMYKLIEEHKKIVNNK